jgi:hypothetical protein
MLKVTGMEEYKLMRYVYENIELALKMSSSIMELFLAEKIYYSHTITSLNSGKYMVTFKITAD